MINESKSNTTTTDIAFYSTTCFGLSSLGHHKVVDFFVEETVQFIQYLMQKVSKHEVNVFAMRSPIGL